MLIVALVRFVRTSLVCENQNNADKFHRRKFIRAADEKLIINKLGPYHYGFFGHINFSIYYLQRSKLSTEC